MNKKVKITDYSCYNNYTIKDKGDNHSDIVSKMIYLAGKICERYASDIVYDANAFIKAIENHENFDKYLFFREYGVTALKPAEVECIESTDFIQAWHLTYNAETEEQEFKRVNVYFERMW